MAPLTKPPSILIKSKRTAVWLAPILITVHNLEEAFLMPMFLARRNAAVANSLGGLLPPITYGQFLVALFIMTAFPYFPAWLAHREEERAGIGLYLLLSMQVMMLVNVFAHVGMAIAMGGYAPGVVTAIAINLPFSIHVLHRAVREKWVSRRAMTMIVPAGAVLHGIALPVVLILAGRIVRGL